MDFYIEDNGEVAKTKVCDNINRYKYQQTICRLKSVKGDFYDTKVGCDLEKYIGITTDAELSTAVSDIMSNLLIPGVISKNDLYIEEDSDFLESGLKVYIKNHYEDSVYEVIRAGFCDMIL